MEQCRLLLLGIVGDDAAAVHLAGRACTGGDAHQRSAVLLKRLFAASLRERVVPQRTRIGHHHDNHLRAVHHRTATQGYHEVAAVFLGFPCAVHGVLSRGVGANLVEQHMLHASQFQLLLHSGQIAVFLRRTAIAGSNQGFPPGQHFIVQVLQLPCAEQYLCRHKKLEIVHTFYYLYVRRLFLDCFFSGKGTTKFPYIGFLKRQTCFAEKFFCKITSQQSRNGRRAK